MQWDLKQVDKAESGADVVVGGAVVEMGSGHRHVLSSFGYNSVTVVSRGHVPGNTSNTEVSPVLSFLWSSAKVLVGIEFVSPLLSPQCALASHLFSL